MEVSEKYEALMKEMIKDLDEAFKDLDNEVEGSLNRAVKLLMKAKKLEKEIDEEIKNK